MLLANLILIPFTFVITPFFVEQVSSIGESMKEMMTSEKYKNEIDEELESFKTNIWYIPILGTNGVLLLCLGIKFLQYRK